MSLDEDLFASGDLIERTVKFPKGKKVVMHFKELPGEDFLKYRLDTASDDETKRIQATAMLIAKSVFNPDGKPAMNFNKARTLKAWAQNAIVGVILEVNGFDGKKDSPSGDQDGSTASSESPSESL